MDFHPGDGFLVDFEEPRRGVTHPYQWEGPPPKCLLTHLGFLSPCTNFELLLLSSRLLLGNTFASRPYMPPHCSSRGPGHVALGEGGPSHRSPCSLARPPGHTVPRWVCLRHGQVRKTGQPNSTEVQDSCSRVLTLRGAVGGCLLAPPQPSCLHWTLLFLLC